MDDLLIGIDVGTTGTKSVLLDPERGIIGQASAPSALESRQPGWAEANPERWWGNVVDTIRELMAKSGARSEAVKAVSTTGMVPAVLALDGSGRPLRNAILQNDARAGQQIQRIRQATAALDLVAATGSALTQQSVAPTALWLQENEPEVWARTRHLVGSYDWVLMALGAEPHVELNWAIESGLYFLGDRVGELVEGVLTAANLDPRVLPPVAAPGKVVGALSAAAATATGLMEGTALVVGGADHVLSAYAAGVSVPGSWLVKLGGAGDILVASDEPVTDTRLYLDAHPAPGVWLPNGCMATSGSLIRWFQTLVGGAELTELDAEATGREPAAVFCLPYFLGEKSPLHDPDLRGAFMGMHLGHSRADLYRSVLEGVAFGFRHHVEIFRELGLNLSRAMITNGGSKSTLWKQIHSEVLGTEMYPVRDHPGASLGAALAAGVGARLFENWQVADRFVQLSDPVIPDPKRVELYSEAYERWRRFGDATTDTAHALARRPRT